MPGLEEPSLVFKARLALPWYVGARSRPDPQAGQARVRAGQEDPGHAGSERPRVVQPQALIIPEGRGGGRRCCAGRGGRRNGLGCACCCVGAEGGRFVGHIASLRDEGLGLLRVCLCASWNHVPKSWHWNALHNPVILPSKHPVSGQLSCGKSYSLSSPYNLKPCSPHPTVLPTHRQPTTQRHGRQRCRVITDTVVSDVV